MYFIKPCPSCGRKLRFPIDRGVINVKCPCGYSFIADPDNTEIYREGAFDLQGAKKTGKYSKGIRNRMTGLSLEKIKTDLIESLLNYKYDLQNFRLMSDEKRKGLIIKTAIIVIIILLAVYFMLLLAGPAEVNEKYI